MVIFLIKRFITINTFLTFAMGFLVHGLYQWIPSSITSIFPVNESLYEHVKLIFYSPIISTFVLYLIYRYKGVKFNNLVYGLFISTLFNIFLFYLVYLPIYYEFGAKLIVTLIIYFITICISNYLYYLIINVDDNRKILNIISFVLIIVCMVVLTYFTYHPIKTDFFRDPEENYYGIKERK